MAESIEEALTLAERIGYPVIVRPSFVIGGLAIDFAYSPEDLVRHLAAAAIVDPDRPVRIDRFLEGIEVDVDAVCDGTAVLIPGLLEHVERAGVHSGDSIACVPAPARRRRATQSLIVRDDGADLPRARRPGPRQRAVHRPRGRRVPDRGQPAGLPDRAVHVQGDRACRWSSSPCGSRSGATLARPRLGGRPAPGARRSSRSRRPAFSTAKLKGVDPSVGPFMQSTGEVIGIAVDPRVAMAKALTGASLVPPRRRRRARRRWRCCRSPTATSGGCSTLARALVARGLPAGRDARAPAPRSRGRASASEPVAKLGAEPGASEAGDPRADRRRPRSGSSSTRRRRAPAPCATRRRSGTRRSPRACCA